MKVSQGSISKAVLRSETAHSSLDDDEQYARQKFGTQKGISSDEFFGRNNFDPSAQSEAKQRLQGFEGATSISSNAYFGRPEDDIPQADEYGNYGDLEGAARDFVRKFGVTAGDDLENLTNVLGEGASKLQGKCILLKVMPPPFMLRLTVCQLYRCDKKLPERLGRVHLLLEGLGVYTVHEPGRKPWSIYSVLGLARNNRGSRLLAY